MIRWPARCRRQGRERPDLRLDWFPTLLAAAGNPNIAEELKKGKQSRRHLQVSWML